MRGSIIVSPPPSPLLLPFTAYCKSSTSLVPQPLHPPPGNPFDRRGMSHCISTRCDWPFGVHHVCSSPSGRAG